MDQFQPFVSYDLHFRFLKDFELNIWFQARKATRTFEKQTTSPLGNCHSLNLNVSREKKLITSHRTKN